MTVREILHEKGRDVFAMRPDATLAEAATELATRRIGALVVMKDDGGIAGILSERDIIRVVGTEGVGSLDRTIAEAMTVNVVTCHEQTGLDELMTTMTSRRFRHVPVVHDGKLIGIVSIGDVVKRRIESVKREAEDMRSYIAAAG